mmetsp:Transcript_10770/g.9213  ORF Transcript_10770/g.9213 Transcript_10770/m.9213 type:complete len:295 (+) Transcript_10770:566-1450(+)
MREREEAARRELEELEHLLHHRVGLESRSVQMGILLALGANVPVKARGNGPAKILDAKGRTHDWHAIRRHLLLHAGVAAHAHGLAGVAAHHRLLAGHAHGLARVTHHLRLARELLLHRLLPRELDWHVLHDLLALLVLGGLFIGCVIAHRAHAHAGNIKNSVPGQVLLVRDGAAEPRRDQDEPEDAVKDGKANGKRNGGGIRSLLERRDALHKHEPPDDAEGQKHVRGHQLDAAVECHFVGVLEDQDLDRHVEDGSEGAREHRRDKPGRDHGQKALLVEVPHHTVPAEGGDANA